MNTEGPFEAQIFSFPRWKRNRPEWSYRFDMRSEGPAITVAYEGNELAEFEMPWEHFAWCFPILWPALILKEQIESLL